MYGDALAIKCHGPRRHEVDRQRLEVCSIYEIFVVERVPFPYQVDQRRNTIVAELPEALLVVHQ